MDIIFDELLMLPPGMQAEIRPVAHALIREEIKKEVVANVNLIRRFVLRFLTGKGEQQIECLREALETGSAWPKTEPKSQEEQEFEKLLNPPPEEGFYFREKFERTAENLVSWLQAYKEANWYPRSTLFFDTEKLISALRWYPAHTTDWVGMKSIFVNAVMRTGILLDALNAARNIEICAFLEEINTAAKALADLIPFEVPAEMIEIY